MSDLRMPDVNRVSLAGRLTRDPELRYLPSGTAVCKLGIAVSRVFRTKEGERKEEVVFINVDTWDKQAEFCRDNLTKGRPILVEGRLMSYEWEDKSTGQKRSTLEVRAFSIQQLDWAPKGGAPAAPEQRPAEEPVAENDIPF